MCVLNDTLLTLMSSYRFLWVPDINTYTEAVIPHKGVSLPFIATFMITDWKLPFVWKNITRY